MVFVACTWPVSYSVMESSDLDAALPEQYGADSIPLATALVMTHDALRDALEAMHEARTRHVHRRFEPQAVSMSQEAFASLTNAWRQQDQPLRKTDWFGPFCVDSDGDVCSGWATSRRNVLMGVDPIWRETILRFAPDGGTFFLAGTEVHLSQKQRFIVPFAAAPHKISNRTSTPGWPRPKE